MKMNAAKPWSPHSKTASCLSRKTAVTGLCFVRIKSQCMLLFIEKVRLKIELALAVTTSWLITQIYTILSRSRSRSKDCDRGRDRERGLNRERDRGDPFDWESAGTSRRCRERSWSREREKERRRSRERERHRDHRDRYR